jgi:DHA1 family bicyclomycin/chloramphenicol resistance-like MFS transporter
LTFWTSPSKKLDIHLLGVLPSEERQRQKSSRPTAFGRTGPTETSLVMQQKFLRTAVVLGLLSAIGPFAVDMYLPALPTIGQDLRASTNAVQMSLLVFFVSMGLGQIVVGPISDMVGRRAPLLVGLGLFIIGSIGSALAPTVESLIAFRFLQGFGACAGMVVPRAIVRDLHTGNDAARLMSLLMLVFSVSPILAPLTGSVIIESFGWRAVFWAVTIAAVVAAVMLMTALQETRPAEHRVGSSFASALSGYRFLLGDRNFLGLTFIGGFGISSFFVYLASSSFILIDHYGLSPWLYSVFFSINAVAFIGMSQLTGMLADRFGLKRVVRVAVVGYAATMVVLLAVMSTGVEQLAVVASLLFVGYGFLGLVIPTTSVLAMEEHGEIAGTASALMGTLHFATGAVAMAVAGLFFDGTPLPMVTGIAACAVIAFALTQLTLGRRRAVAEMPAE